jgi:hypothetical protein
MTNCTQIKFIFAKQTKKLTEEKGHGQQQINNLVATKVVKQSKAKQSRYTPWRRLGGEEV